MTPATIPRSYIRVRAVVWECGEEQTDTQMAVTSIHFASATPHAKCNEEEETVMCLCACLYVLSSLIQSENLVYIETF